MTTVRRSRRWLANWVLWCSVLLVPLLNWPATALPFERDEGEYAWAAAIAGRGGVPYRDTFLQKPPGIILVYRAILGVSSGSPLAVHIALLLVYTLTAVGIGAIALRLSGRRMTAAVAIAFFAMSLSTPFYKASAANTEAFMVAAVVGAVYSLLRLRESRSLGWVVAVGAALGLAVMMKQTGAAHALWLVPALAAAAPTARERWQWPVVAILAATVVAAFVCIPYVSAGAGSELMDGMLWHNLEYTGATLERAFWQRAHVRALDIEQFHIAVWLLAVIGLAVIARKRQWWAVIILGGWAASAWIGVSAGAVYRGHYFLQLLPPVAILSAWTLAVAPRRIQLVAAPVALTYWLFSDGLQWGVSERTLADQRYHTSRFANAQVIGRWLAGQADRSLYILGSEPEIYYYAAATPVTRYVIQHPLFGGFESSRRRQLEVWAAVERARPRWIITELPLEVIPFFAGSDAWLKTQVEQLLAAEYQPRLVAVESRVGVASANTVGSSEVSQITVWERAARPTSASPSLRVPAAAPRALPRGR